MSSNSKIILSQHTHSGSILSEAIVGEKEKGDGFYGRSDGIHTVQYSVTEFEGTVIIEATLATEPVEADWFPVYQQSHPTDDDDLITITKITNFTGNYVWVRAKVVYFEGTVNRVLLNH
jgi:hypothetical protein